MVKKAKRKRTVHLTERSLRDIAAIETYSIQQFGKRVANQYFEKFESAINRIAKNPDILRNEPGFHASLKFYRVEKHVFVCETGISGKIIILTVLHASMDIPTRLAELEENLSLELEILLQQLRRANE